MAELKEQRATAMFIEAEDEDTRNEILGELQEIESKLVSSRRACQEMKIQISKGQELHNRSVIELKSVLADLKFKHGENRLQRLRVKLDR